MAGIAPRNALERFALILHPARPRSVPKKSLANEWSPNTTVTAIPRASADGISEFGRFGVQAGGARSLGTLQWPPAAGLPWRLSTKCVGHSARMGSDAGCTAGRQRWRIAISDILRVAPAAVPSVSMPFTAHLPPAPRGAGLRLPAPEVGLPAGAHRRGGMPRVPKHVSPRDMAAARRHPQACGNPGRVGGSNPLIPRPRRWCRAGVRKPSGFRLGPLLLMRCVQPPARPEPITQAARSWGWRPRAPAQPRLLRLDQHGILGRSRLWG